MISAGWNCSGPAPSQRRAPLTSTPKPGTSTSSSRTKAASSSSGVEPPHLLEPVAREQLHQHEPDRAVDQVLDEVRRAVAVAPSSVRADEAE